MPASTMNRAVRCQVPALQPAMSEGSTEASLRGRMLYPDSIDHPVREDNRGLMDVDALSLFCRMIGLASISMDEDKDGTSQNKTTQRKTKVPEKTTKKRIQKRTTDKKRILLFHQKRFIC